MPVASISPNKFVKVLYNHARRGSLGINVSADRAIDIYTVPLSEYDRWKSRREYVGSASYFRRRNLGLEFNSGPEFEEDWYLIMENFQNERAQVEYEVFER